MVEEFLLIACLAGMHSSHVTAMGSSSESMGQGGGVFSSGAGGVTTSLRLAAAVGQGAIQVWQVPG